MALVDSMDIAEDPDIALEIPLRALYEEYACPICFNIVKDCFMTICGHNFCEKCIKECLNRKHSCPCCNKATNVEQLYKNLQHDRIVSILQKEKDIASKKYFEKLISKDPAEKPENGKPVQKPSAPFSPIEELFHKYMKKSLMTYEEYRQDVMSKFEKTKESIKKEYTDKMKELNDKCQAEMRVNPQNDLKVRLDIEISQLVAECELKIKKIEDSTENFTSLLMNAFESYLKDVIPAQSFLPVSVSISVQNRGLVMKKVILKPIDNVTDLKNMIEAKLKEMGDPLLKWKPQNQFILKRPFHDPSINDEQVTPEGAVIIHDEIRPLLQYKIPQGSELILIGALETQSSAPKECFCNTYDKDKVQKMDYYTCKECKLNWICKPCSESCHRGHTINEYILGHQPTWACCYCKKSRLGKCQISKK